MANDVKVSTGGYFYGGLLYKPCGVCDVCCDPMLAYSDCGQPVPVERVVSERQEGDDA